ncbi:hypothetical protein TWF730_003782 [Orbilia blumenaviensis]|uniref:C2H2-type domain-containing protein n=1 Tax=Orbilia blumenaviensis TaxID=1796055 RepID=A0AAV9U3S1_9PEZI
MSSSRVFCCVKINCTAVFAKSCELTKHRREFHQRTTTLTYADGSKRLIERSPSGYFSCSCGIKYRNPNALLVHAKDCAVHLAAEGVEQTDEDGSDAEDESDAEEESEDENGQESTEELDDESLPLSRPVGVSASELTAAHIELEIAPELELEPLDEGAFDVDDTTLRNLRYINLEIVSELRALVCLDCGFCINPSRIHSHRLRLHGRKVNRSELIALERQLTPLPFLPHGDLARWVPHLRRIGPVPPFPYFPVSDGFECTRCGRLRATLDSIKHHGKACNGASFVKCHVQALTVGIGSSYFKVAVPEVENHMTEAEGALQKQLDILASAMRQLDAVVTEEVREPPWITRTGWHDYADMRIMATLSRLTYKPAPEDRNFEVLDAVFTQTKALLHQYLNLIDDTDNITLRNIRSPNEDLDLRPFSRRHQKRTHLKYFTWMARLVCFVVRITYDETDKIATGVVMPSATLAIIQNIKRCAVEPDSSETLAAEIGSLMWELLSEKVYINRKFGNLTVNFLALMGYCPSNQTFKSPERYTPLLAGLMFCFRLVALRSCWDAVDGDEALAEPARTQRFHASADEICQRLKDSCRTTAGEILGLHSAGAFHLRNHAAPGQVQWNVEDGYQSLNLDGECFSIPKFTSLVKHVFECLETELNYLLFSTDRGGWPPLPDRLFDVPSNTAADWSFRSDQRNHSTIQELSRFMVISLMRDPAKKGRLYGNMDVLLDSAVEQYTTHVSRYLALLCLAMQFTCGQPIRSTEILTLRFKNTEYHQRNIYIIENRTVMITTSYSKTQETKGKLKNICRFPPPFLADQIIYYLTTVLPFYWYLLERSRELKKSPFLFVTPNAERWRAERLAAFMEEEAFSVMDFELRPRKYRQIAIAIAKRYVEPLSLVIERQRNQSVNIYAYQAGHTNDMRDFSYGVDANDIIGITAESITESRHASVYWQVFIGALDELPEWVVYPPVLASKLSKAYALALFRSNENLIRQMRLLSDIPLVPHEPTAARLLDECESRNSGSGLVSVSTEADGDTDMLDTQSFGTDFNIENALLPMLDAYSPL